MASLESYRAFLAVADYRSFSKAAAALGLSSAKVSRAVAEWEAELGFPLFQRTTRQVDITPRGATLLEPLRAAVTSLTEAVEGQRSDNKGRPFKVLRLACGEAEAAALLAPALPGFLEIYPQAEVTFETIARAVVPQLDGFDLAFKLMASPPGGSTVIASLDQALVASPDYCAMHNRIYTAADVAQHRALVWSGQPQWLLRNSEAIALRPHLLSNNIKLIYDCCIAAKGVALLPMALVRGDIAAQQLVQLLDGFEPRPLNLVADWGERPEPASGAAAFLDYLKDYLRQNRF